MKSDGNITSNASSNNVVNMEMKNQTNEKDSEMDFEDALKLTGVGRYNYMLLFVVILSLLAAAAEMFGLGVLVISSQCDLGLDIPKKGLMGSVPMLGVLGGAHFWGYQADTKGRRFTLLITTAGSCIMAFVSSFANNWIYLLVAKLGSSLCASGTNAVVYALLGESTPASSRSKFVMYSSSGIMMSQAFVAVLSFPILIFDFSYDLSLLGITYRPWRLLSQVFGLASLASFATLYLFTYESPKFFFSNGNHDMGLEILSKIRKINTSEPTFGVKRVVLNEDKNKLENQNIFQSMWHQTKPMFYKKHIKTTLLTSYICIVSYSISPGYVMWLPQIFNSYMEITDPSTTFCEMIKTMDKSVPTNNMTWIPECNDTIDPMTFAALSAFACFACIASIVSTIAIGYIGKKKVFVGVHVICAVCIVAINKVPASIGVFVFCGSLTNVLCMGLSTVYVVELFPTYMRAMAVCLTMMLGRGVSFIIINILGTQLLNNCNNWLYIVLAYIISGGLVGCLLPGDKKKQDNAVVKEENSSNP